jgi:hypothetical protein
MNVASKIVFFATTMIFEGLFNVTMFDSFEIVFVATFWTMDA